MSQPVASVGPVVVPPWGVLPEVPGPLRPGDRVLVVGAHPDDETIGAGRLLADHPGEVTAVTLSAGEHCVADLAPDVMAERRLREWRTALRELGVVPDEASLGRWPDGALAEHESAITDALADLAASYDVVVATWRHDPHPDHRATGRAAAEAAVRTGARLVEFVVWAPYWMSLETTRDLGYAVGTCPSSLLAGEARARALAAYPSQTTALRPGLAPVVPQALLNRHHHQMLAVPR